MLIFTIMNWIINQQKKVMKMKMIMNQFKKMLKWFLMKKKVIA